MATVGFVGLGTMGGRMAKRCSTPAAQVVGYNRTPAKARALVAAGLTLAKSPRAVAEASDAVFSMVTDSAALRAIALGPDGVIAGTPPRRRLGRDEHGEPGGHARAGPGGRRARRRADRRPVSGSPVTLDAGQLSFMVGGDPAALEKVRATSWRSGRPSPTSASSDSR